MQAASAEHVFSSAEVQAAAGTLAVGGSAKQGLITSTSPIHTTVKRFTADLGAADHSQNVIWGRWYDLNQRYFQSIGKSYLYCDWKRPRRRPPFFGKT